MVSMFAAFSLTAQTSVKGSVKVAGAETFLSGAKITLLQQKISTQTNANGEFVLTLVEPGDDEISISMPGYLTQIKLVSLKKDLVNDLGVFELKPDQQQEIKQDIVIQLNETEINDDEGRANQISGAQLSSRGDVYNSQASFSFSPMRFSVRGYDQDMESTYINGVQFNGLERGGFNYSSLGGLNDAMRNQEVINGIEANSFSYGNLGSTTNINTKASSYAAGSKASLAFTNRTYKLRGQYTYATGLKPNGWAFAGSAVVRWADEGIVEGTFYKSVGYFLSAEKVLNKNHSFSLVTFGAPTQRAQQAAVTQETYDLAGSIYYNPYWGYQNGKKRNSRIVNSFDPTVILSHDFKIDEKQRLRTGLAYHYSKYSNSALNFYNAPDPRPDYYRNLPSYQDDADIQQQIAALWTSDTNVSQVDWTELYRDNLLNNTDNPTGNAKYAVERRHNDLMETALNSTYTNQISKELKLTAGVEGKMSKAMHYKTMDDLLGANQWIDIDQFSERDFPNNSSLMQNDLNHPNAKIGIGDVFGYNYDINIINASAFIQNEWVLPQVDLYYAAKVTSTQFSRFGHMRNGRAEALNVISYGKGKTWFTADPSIKAGATYKIDGRNRLSANVMAETLAPNIDNAYISPRIKDTAVPMESEKLLTYDLNYTFTYPFVRGRISGFRTHTLDGIDLNGYYDDTNNTFVNHVLTKVDKLYQGVEAGLSFKLNASFTLSLAGTVADYHYTDNAMGVLSFENGSQADQWDEVLIKDKKLSSGPQTAGSIQLSYFNSKMWFVDLTLNYFDRNYLDLAPLRFTKTNMETYVTPEIMNVLGTQERLKGGYLLDASVGKVVYLKNRKSLNFNLSCNNILNNTKMITGGYSQARIDVTALNKFPAKYYYAWGFNMFMNIGFKF